MYRIERSQRRVATLPYHVTIATGSVVAGSLGSAQRLKYTTVGDTVNVAARLESLDTKRIPPCPKLRYRILLDEATLKYVSQEVHVQEMGEIAVKGREQQVKVFQLEYRSEKSQEHKSHAL